MKYIFLFFALILNAKEIKFLDAFVIPTQKIDGVKFVEVSDIAYDKKNRLFYAVSDKGYIFLLKIDIRDKKFKGIKLLRGKRLKDFKESRVVKKRLDSEGLALDGDTLLVSFEGSSRINRYSKDFKLLSRVKLPKKLQYWVNRDLSKDGFEALAFSKKRGFITLRERPLFLEKKGFHTIFDSHGKICSFRVDPNFKAVTEIELLGDGNLLALFREFSFKRLSFMIALKEIDINHIKDGICSTKTLALLDGRSDKFVDNFEGLTHYKDNLYIMISDDNNNFFERTILRLFELKE